MALGMSNEIPPDQLAGYCCPMPAIQFSWLLGTEHGNTNARVLVLTDTRCLNCGTPYRWKGTATLMPNEGGKTIILDVDVDPQVLQ